MQLTLKLACVIALHSLCVETYAGQPSRSCPDRATDEYYFYSGMFERDPERDQFTRALVFAGILEQCRSRPCHAAP